MSFNVPPLHGFTNEPDEEFEGDIETSDVDVAEGGLAGIGDILNGLYTKPVFAVIREYLMNAVDSHHKAGTLEPVKLYAANNEPFRTYDNQFFYDKTYFVVKDSGTGMTREEVINSFAKYGGSTKTNDRKVVGKLGVGAKSALSVSSYFEIITVKDGYRTVATINKESRSSLSKLHVKIHEKTSKSNGTTIRVPMPLNFMASYSETYAHFKSLLWTFPEDSVLLNGNPVPEAGKLLDSENYLPVMSVTGEPFAWISVLKDNLTFRQVGYVKIKRPNIIMGGVPYIYTKEQWNDTLEDKRNVIPSTISRLEELGHEVYLNIPPKGLDLSPNREHIKVIPENTKYVFEVYKELEKFIQPVFTQRLNELEEREAYFFRGFNAYALNPEIPFENYEGHYYRSEMNKQHPLPEYYYRGQLMHNELNLSDFYDAKEMHFTGKNIESKIYLVNFAGERVPNSTFYKRKTYSRSNINLIVYGKNMGKTKNPIAAYAKNALKQLGYRLNDVDLNVAYIDSDKPFPKEYLNTGLILPLDELKELDRQWRAENYKKPEHKPVSKEKSVQNSYYIVFNTNEDGEPTIQLWHKSDVKAQEGKVYYLEEKTIERELKRRNPYYAYSLNWDGIRKGFASHEETVNIPRNLEEYGKIATILDAPLALIPKNKSSNVFFSANEEDIFVPLADVGKKVWEKASAREKKLFGLFLLLETTNLANDYVFKKRWVDITNGYLKDVFEGLDSKETRTYKTAVLLANSILHGDSYSYIRKEIPLFEKYWHQTVKPSPEVLDAIAGISELKS